MRKILFALILTTTVVQIQAQHSFDDFFKLSDQFFQENVYRGMVNYQSIYEKPNYLDKLVLMIEKMPLDEKSNEDVRKAFYINAYNLLVIKGIINSWPAASPLDIEGFFDKTKYMVAGKATTLSDLENEVIRKEFQDARIHFALVCAARDCPPLISNSYQPRTIDGLLERQAVTTLNNRKFVRLSADGTTLFLSKLFEWYAEDFATGKDDGPIDYINQYLNKKISSDVEIEYMEYNWKLNQGNSGSK